MKASMPAELPLLRPSLGKLPERLVMSLHDPCGRLGHAPPPDQTYWLDDQGLAPGRQGGLSGVFAFSAAGTGTGRVAGRTGVAREPGARGCAVTAVRGAGDAVLDVSGASALFGRTLV